jgi:cytochrome c oxidase accessory protein FixG
VIDLTSRIIQTPRTPFQAPNGAAKWHPWRRVLQVVCGVLLAALPLTNGLRLDVRRDEFYFAWHRMAAHDLVLLFWVAMLGVWAMTAVSLLYGRLWCGWVCPQTLASDFADSLKTRLEKSFRRRWSGRFGPKRAVAASRGVWTAALLAMALGTGMLLACYWLAPRTVAWATTHPWGDVPAALTVYGITAILAADMLWVRRKFCSHGCPYGALMSLLADKNTLAVRYLDERDDDCIRCGKCVTDCPMGIDIKQGVGQLSCIGCGECVDSCNDVLGKRGKAGLIEFRYGVEPGRATAGLAPMQRWGLWDGKRWTVIAVLVAFLGVVLWNIYGHAPLSANVIANGAIGRDARMVRNTYSLTIANGTPDDQTYTLTPDGLPQGSVEPSPRVRVAAHDTRTLAVTLATPIPLMQPNHRTAVRLQVRGGGQQLPIQTFFYTPAP